MQPLTTCIISGLNNVCIWEVNTNQMLDVLFPIAVITLLVVIPLVVVWVSITTIRFFKPEIELNQRVYQDYQKHAQEYELSEDVWESSHIKHKRRN